MTQLPDSADVVVIGGGIVGASVAYFLARAGAGRIVLVERNLFGSGSSSRAAGGIRQQFSTEVNVRLSLKSLDFYHRFEAELGVDVSFHQSGYLFLLTEGHIWKAFQRNALMQRSLGVPVQLLDARGALRLVPQLNADGIAGATYCPTDGYADPGAAVAGFVAGCRRLGVACLDETSVNGIRLDGDAVAAVSTSNGDVRCPTIVNCAGAFSAGIGRMVGLDLPVVPYRRQLYLTEPFDGVPMEMPLTVDFGTKFYCRREGGAILMGMDDPNEPPGEDIVTTTDFLERLTIAASNRIPALAAARLRTGWGGLYEVTPDHNPLLGATAVRGFFCACGFSGHGFMHAPAAGMAIADLITTGATDPDVSELAPDRFTRGAQIRETAVI